MGFDHGIYKGAPLWHSVDHNDDSDANMVKYDEMIKLRNERMIADWRGSRFLSAEFTRKMPSAMKNILLEHGEVQITGWLIRQVIEEYEEQLWRNRAHMSDWLEVKHLLSMLLSFIKDDEVYTYWISS